MIRLAAALLALGLALPARAGLDADLARFSDAPGGRLVIPRLDRVLGPLGDLVLRLQQHPDWASFLGIPLSVFLARTGIDLTDPAALAQHGLRLDGPLWVHRGAQTVASLPFQDGPKAAAFLASLAALPSEPADGGWALGGLRLRHAGGRMLVADDPAAMDRWGGPVPADAAKAPLAGCPRAPGEADLWLRWVSALGAACLTARIEPDRVRLDVQVHSALVKGWLGKPGPWPALPTQPTAAVGVRLGPKALKQLRAKATPQAAQVAAALTGALHAAAGPGPTDLYVRAALAEGLPPGVPPAARSALARLGRTVADGAGYLIYPREVQAEPTALARLERSPAGLVIRGPGAAPTLADLPGSLAGRAHVDPALWKDASAFLWLRFSGPPHDGQPYLDAVRPALTFLDRDLAQAQRVAAALAWVAAHVGEVAVAAWPTPDGLAFAIEVIRL